MKKTSVRSVAAVLCLIMMICLPGCSAFVPSAPVAGSGTATDSSDATKSTGKRIYFAGPLFSQAEREYNEKITRVLEDYGYEVFLPQRDGFLAAELEGKTEQEKTDMIFAKDVEEVKKSDIVFMILDGRIPDEGACVELGIAYAEGKRCYGFKTDARTIELDMELNPMISGCFKKIFLNYDGDKLLEELKQYLAENEL